MEQGDCIEMLRVRGEERMERVGQRSEITLRRIEQDDTTLKNLHISSRASNLADHSVGEFLSHDRAHFARLGEAVGKKHIWRVCLTVMAPLTVFRRF